MAKWCIWLYLAVIAFSAVLALKASAYTDDLDVMALQDLYIALNHSPQLKRWKLGSADPCRRSWMGVSCCGSSVTHIKLHGLELTGTLGSSLSNLIFLKELDVSSNNIQGEIPNDLPLGVTHINLACNNFSGNIPFTLTSMRNLQHLNLSHNSLSGPLGNVFEGLHNLREMDLSYNNFTGDLTSSFGSLTNMSRLFLQDNGFSGSVMFLANLPVSDLNIRDNHFSGILPSQFQYIHNLWFDGNSLKAPWTFPLEIVPTEQNISSPPTTKSSATESYPSPKVGRHEKDRKKRLGPGGLACMVVGGTLVAACAALIIVIRIHRSRAKKYSSVELCSEYSQQSLPLCTTKGQTVSEVQNVDASKS